MSEFEDIDDDYELEVLFELRRNERDDAEQRYAEAMEEHESVAGRLEKLHREHREMVAERERVCREFDEQLDEGGRTLEEVRKFDRYVSGLRDREEQMLVRIEKTRRQRRRARKRMERAHDEMLAAIRRLEAVKAHYDGWSEQRRTEHKRRESAEMDDIAARIWREQNR